MGLTTSIYKTIGEPAMLEQLAEECCELGHAALKMSRVLRGENPTPAVLPEALQAFLEEAADVTLCLDEWLRNKDPYCIDEINRMMEVKEIRWRIRIQKSE